MPNTPTNLYDLYGTVPQTAPAPVALPTQYAAPPNYVPAEAHPGTPASYVSRIKQAMGAQQTRPLPTWQEQQEEQLASRPQYAAPPDYQEDPTAPTVPTAPAAAACPTCGTTTAQPPMQVGTPQQAALPKFVRP